MGRRGQRNVRKPEAAKKNSLTLKNAKALRKEDTRQEQEAPDRKRIISESIA